MLLGEDATQIHVAGQSDNLHLLLSVFAHRGLFFPELAVEPYYLMLFDIMGLKECFAMDEAVVFLVDDPFYRIGTSPPLMAASHPHPSGVSGVELAVRTTPDNNQFSRRFHASNSNLVHVEPILTGL